MKKILFLCFLGQLSFTYGEDSTVQEVPSKIEQVTVYQQGARITRISKPQLKKGDNQLVLKGISADMDIRTLQVAVSDELTLDMLTPRSNLLGENEVSAEVKKMITQKKEKEVQKKMIAAEIAALQSGLLIMEENKKLKDPSVQSLSEWIAFNQKKILEIKKQLIDKESDLATIEEEIEKLIGQIQTEKQNPQAQTMDVVLNIKAARAGTFSIAVMYMVQQAGWTPTYDLRTMEVGAPVEFTLKGAIYQQTGLPWNDVQIELSTYKPQYDNNRPILYPSYAYLSTYVGARDEMLAANVYQLYQNKDNAKLEKVQLFENSQPVKQEEGLNVSYTLQGAKTIPPSGEPVALTIETQQSEASYIYHTVPKLQEKVILLANIKNWENLGLLRGEAHVFFKNNYVGKTYIDPTQIKQKLPVSLGVDERILIRRIRTKNYNQTYKLKSNQEELYSYQIKMKNNTNTRITIEILDQIPISSDSKITVKPLEYGDGNYKEDNGRILWERELQAHQEDLIRLKYKVIYPKDENVQFRN